jgi:hypothetical protein
VLYYETGGVLCKALNSSPVLPMNHVLFGSLYFPKCTDVCHLFWCSFFTLLNPNGVVYLLGSLCPIFFYMNLWIMNVLPSYISWFPFASLLVVPYTCCCRLCMLHQVNFRCFHLPFGHVAPSYFLLCLSLRILLVGPILLGLYESSFVWGAQEEWKLHQPRANTLIVCVMSNHSCRENTCSWAE